MLLKNLIVNVWRKMSSKLEEAVVEKDNTFNNFEITSSNNVSIDFRIENDFCS